MSETQPQSRYSAENWMMFVFFALCQSNLVVDLKWLSSLLVQPFKNLPQPFGRSPSAVQNFSTAVQPFKTFPQPFTVSREPFKNFPQPFSRSLWTVQKLFSAVQLFTLSRSKFLFGRSAVHVCRFNRLGHPFVIRSLAVRFAVRTDSH